MLCADFEKQGRVGVGAKAVKRIGAAQRDRVRLHKPVPQFLEAHRCLPASISPQERHHLAEYADLARFGDAGENSFDSAREQSLVRPLIAHEGRKHLGRIAADEAALFDQLVEIDALVRKFSCQADAMRFGADVHTAIAGAEAVGEPSRQRVD